MHILRREIIRVKADLPESDLECEKLRKECFYLVIVNKFNDLKVLN